MNPVPNALRPAPSALRRLLKATDPTVLVEVTAVRGSAPRETGAWMLVASRDVAGTIGGGQLEYMAIDAARRLLRRGGPSQTMVVPLGPQIGQCCGGQVTLSLAAVDACLAAALDRRLAAQAEAQPAVLIFGAGHVGRALAAALALLPVRPVLIDQRAGELALAPPGAETRLTALPEAEVSTARQGSVFVVLTHDHALDFLVADAALARGDASYVGLIGSKSKRARFRAWRARHGSGRHAALAGLTCPIGGPSGDKRPEVIAAMVAAEIMRNLGDRPGVAAPRAPSEEETSDSDSYATH